MAKLCNLLLLVLSQAAFGQYKYSGFDIPAGMKTATLAGGCFWCMEEAFERYVPGVVEAVSGFSGGDNSIQPTYKSHPGHFEVIQVVYDPALTSYPVLLEYYWRNVDPFDDTGQFCDKGGPYKPAIFYDGESERRVAEESKSSIQAAHPTWGPIVVPLLPIDKFWPAEDYHQDYYIKSEEWYRYYKNGCRRVQRLKEVWGEDAYSCFHTKTPCEGMDTVRNDANATVGTKANIKGAPMAAESSSSGLPSEILAVVVIAGVIGAACLAATCYTLARSFNKSPNPA